MRGLLMTLGLISLGCKPQVVGPTYDASVSDGVPILAHRIFIARETVNGNLGGLLGADAFCQTEARKAGLIRNYRSMLSDESVDLRDRVTIDGQVFVVRGNEAALVAEDVTELWSGSIRTAVNADQYGVLDSVFQPGGAPLLTGSTPAGTKVSGHTCDSWTRSSGGAGRWGLAGELGAQWISSVSLSCDSPAPGVFYRVMCISQ